MEQSPKANRPHAPWETPADDGLPTQDSGGLEVKNQAPSNIPFATPKPMDGRFQGGIQDGEYDSSTSQPAEMGSGRPGYVGEHPDPDSLVHLFETDRGRNS